MKKLGVVFSILIVCLVGCGQDKLVFKSDSYGVESEITVYFEEEKATRASTKTVFETVKEAKAEYEAIKTSEVYLNPKLDGKTVTYEQKDYISGMSKKEVKALFKEAE